MPIMFNMLLEAAGIAPKDVRLLRHQDTRAMRRRSVYRLWRDDPDAFEAYQSGQSAASRADFAAPFWASFAAADGDTLFIGLYRVADRRAGEGDYVNPLSGQATAAELYDRYTLVRADELADFAGLLTVDWGPGLRSWVQRADNQNKRVLELRREAKDPDFPGYAAFMSQLSDVENFPATWATALGASRGVYLLTCPRTNEQYVGAAYGADGFLGRWRQYAANGHGENVVLKSRDASDYRVSILEGAGSAASNDDILQMEARWKAKLQSREMGLNGN